MPYLYETHLHTCQASKCGTSTGREHAQYYKEIGYRGIIVTDHFFGGNTAVPKEMKWCDRVEMFCSGYEDAYREGQKIGLDVFFGWEQNYDLDEYLIYGLDKQWLLEHPEVETCTRREQLEMVHRAGGCVIQAHPFRDRGYIPRILLGKEFCDGIEVANAGQNPVNDYAALRYAREFDLLTIAGSDNHHSYSERWTADKVMGIALDKPLESIHDLVRIIRNREPIGLHIPEGRFDIAPEDQLVLDAFWLDKNENAVPTNRDWVHG